MNIKVESQSKLLNNNNEFQPDAQKQFGSPDTQIGPKLKLWTHNGITYRWSSIGFDKPLIRRSKKLNDDFDKEVAKRFGKGAESDFANMIAYRDSWNQYLTTYFFKSGYSKFLWLTFHRKPCHDQTAENTLRDFLNRVNRIVFKSQYRNRRKWLATIAIIEGTT